MMFLSQEAAQFGPTAVDRVGPDVADRVGPDVADRVGPAVANRALPTVSCDQPHWALYCPACFDPCE
ncbi:hypothetical protein L1987_48717 [Smallanthus sonchifolius]|uniref:Uncharacterized protein n=1 Tax=Smallanthus sonchifolius TaxID=185202 RepID=A0ACB9FS34_9ASTR|nr:hypothetical protein L1987_48717 [Smallanthus sonchifolius]